MVTLVAKGLYLEVNVAKIREDEIDEYKEYFEDDPMDWDNDLYDTFDYVLDSMPGNIPFYIESEDGNLTEVEINRSGEKRLTMTEYDFTEGVYAVRLDVYKGQSEFEIEDEEKFAPKKVELYKVEDESVFFHGADRILYGDECIEGECTGRFDDNILWCIIKNGVIVEASDDKKIGTRLAVKPNPVLAKVNKNTKGTFEIPEGKTEIGDAAFYGCDEITNVVIPDSVERIGDCAFYGCSSLEELVIPDSVKSIGDGAFYDCVSLKKLILSKGLTAISGDMCWGCSSLESIEIPESVTMIGGDAFAYCPSLKSAKIPASLPDFDRECLEYIVNYNNANGNKEQEADGRVTVEVGKLNRMLQGLAIGYMILNPETTISKLEEVVKESGMNPKNPLFVPSKSVTSAIKDKYHNEEQDTIVVEGEEYAVYHCYDNKYVDAIKEVAEKYEINLVCTESKKKDDKIHVKSITKINANKKNRVLWAFAKAYMDAHPDSDLMKLGEMIAKYLKWNAKSPLFTLKGDITEETQRKYFCEESDIVYSNGSDYTVYHWYDNKLVAGMVRLARKMGIEIRVN